MNQDTQRSDDRKELIDTFKRIQREQPTVAIQVPSDETWAIFCALGDAAKYNEDQGYPYNAASLRALQDMIREQLETQE